MKIITNQLSKMLAKLTYGVASKGAGLASDWGWYQPKVPEKLSK